MKMGWRWYGEGNDPITLRDIKQIPGVTSTRENEKTIGCLEHSTILSITKIIVSQKSGTV